VRVFVILHEARLMGVRMRVTLPVVTVLMLVLDVVVIMQDVRMRMSHIPVAVLVSVRRSHSCSIPGRFYSSRSPNRLN
jgi:hypothetical protein